MARLIVKSILRHKSIRELNKYISDEDSTTETLSVSGVAVAPLFERLLRQQKLGATKDVHGVQDQGPGERLDDIEQIDDTDGQKFSEETSLDNLEQAKNFLKRSHAFLGLYEKLHAWIFPITKDYIRHTILANTALEKSYLKLHCQVDGNWPTIVNMSFLGIRNCIGF